jgi:uncharacterized protein YbbK (DUF523 family)
VVNIEGKDVTTEFLAGAQKALHIAQRWGIKEAVLKARSPSCGMGQIYDGSFSGRLVEGDGVTTALLKREGIAVKTEEDPKKEKASWGRSWSVCRISAKGGGRRSLTRSRKP